MVIQDNLLLSRTEPNGMGGTQFLYKVKEYGVVAVTRPEENIANIHWLVDIIRYSNTSPIEYSVCHTTELADKTLKFYNDKSLNEFLEKAFAYFNELDLLEKMLPEEKDG